MADPCKNCEELECDYPCKEKYKHLYKLSRKEKTDEIFPENSCIYCTYYVSKKYPYLNREIGECHRFPMESKVYTVFHWCGEFKKRKK